MTSGSWGPHSSLATSIATAALAISNPGRSQSGTTGWGFNLNPFQGRAPQVARPVQVRHLSILSLFIHSKVWWLFMYLIFVYFIYFYGSQRKQLQLHRIWLYYVWGWRRVHTKSIYGWADFIHEHIYYSHHEYELRSQSFMTTACVENMNKWVLHPVCWGSCGYRHMFLCCREHVFF